MHNHTQPYLKLAENARTLLDIHESSHADSMTTQLLSFGSTSGLLRDYEIEEFMSADSDTIESHYDAVFCAVANALVRGLVQIKNPYPEILDNATSANALDLVKAQIMRLSGNSFYKGHKQAPFKLTTSALDDAVFAERIKEFVPSLSHTAIEMFVKLVNSEQGSIESMCAVTATPLEVKNVMAPIVYLTSKDKLVVNHDIKNELVGLKALYSKIATLDKPLLPVDELHAKKLAALTTELDTVRDLSETESVDKSCWTCVNAIDNLPKLSISELIETLTSFDANVNFKSSSHAISPLISFEHLCGRLAAYADYLYTALHAIADAVVSARFLEGHIDDVCATLTDYYELLLSATDGELTSLRERYLEPVDYYANTFGQRLYDLDPHFTDKVRDDMGLQLKLVIERLSKFKYLLATDLNAANTIELKGALPYLQTLFSDASLEQLDNAVLLNGNDVTLNPHDLMKLTISSSDVVSGIGVTRIRYHNPTPHCFTQALKDWMGGYGEFYKQLCDAIVASTFMQKQDAIIGDLDEVIAANTFDNKLHLRAYCSEVDHPAINTVFEGIAEKSSDGTMVPTDETMYRLASAFTTKPVRIHDVEPLTISSAAGLFSADTLLTDYPQKEIMVQQAALHDKHMVINTRIQQIYGMAASGDYISDELDVCLQRYKTASDNIFVETNFIHELTHAAYTAVIEQMVNNEALLTNISYLLYTALGE